jgi:hypothetical protein
VVGSGLRLGWRRTRIRPSKSAAFLKLHQFMKEISVPTDPGQPNNLMGGNVSGIKDRRGTCMISPVYAIRSLEDVGTYANY